jgi:hypothetical protein
MLLLSVYGKPCVGNGTIHWFTSWLKPLETLGLLQCTDNEGAMSCPTYDDYEDDDIAAPCAPLALSYQVHDTDTYDK